MKGWDSHLTLILLVVSNMVAILLLIFSLRWPRLARISFFIVFAWAAWTNWHTSRAHPEYYLDYAQLAWSKWYVKFISGWFATHISTLVGFIAICQALIALSMLLRGWIFLTGCAGGILFLIAILPLGTGAGFPCTAVMAAALFVLMRQSPANYIWKFARKDKMNKPAISRTSFNSQFP